MATRSAEKAHRKSLKRRIHNRAVRSATKTMIRRAVASIASGDLEVARESVRAAIITLDRAASKGIIHANNAARHKSRLLLKYNAAVAASQPSPPAKSTGSGQARRGRTKK